MIDLHAIPGGFELRYRQRVIIRHSIRRPALWIGQGVGRWRASHGNFRVSQNLQQRIACREPVMAGNEVHFPNLARLRFGERQGALQIECRPEQPGFNRLWLMLCCARGEQIFGCGEQFSHIDLRGRRVPLWVREQGVGRGHNLITLYANLHSHAGGAWHTTYFPLPRFVASSGWYCHVAGSSYACFDFRPANHVVLELWQATACVTVGVTDSLTEAVTALSLVGGRQPPLPRWVGRGLILGAQGGTAVVEQKLARARRAGIEVSALWVQDWEGKRETAFGRQLMWDWQYDARLYHDLPRRIADWRESGVRFLGYINPFLVPEGALYSEASRRGYLVQRPQGGDYHVVVTTFPAGLLDLTNPEACRWIKQVIEHNMVAIGMSGWMADYGEYLPTDARLADGSDAAIWHNRYPAEWARVNYEAVAELGATDEIFFFMRAGYDQGTRYVPALFAGDQLVDWSRHDGLPSVLPAALSAGMSGIGVVHSDIGGFTSVAWKRRRRELFLRWAEQAAFSPIMRTHEGNRPDSNWQFDSDQLTLKHLARMSQIYRALRPYHQQLLQAYQQSGLAPMRPLALHWHRVPATVLRRQYLYGSDMLVAPVLAPNRRHWSVWLPPDDWVDMWSGRPIAGGWHSVSAPWGYPPVFYRAAASNRTLFAEIGQRFGRQASE